MLYPRSSNNEISTYAHQNYVLAYNTYKEAVTSARDNAKINAAKDAGEMFNVEPAFMFYADDFGLEHAMEYWVNATWVTEAPKKKKAEEKEDTKMEAEAFLETVQSDSDTEKETQIW